MNLKDQIKQAAGVLREVVSQPQPTLGLIPAKLALSKILVDFSKLPRQILIPKIGLKNRKPA